MTRPAIAFAVASMRNGALLRADDAEADSVQLQELAATLPEIFGTFDPSCLKSIGARLGVEGSAEEFAEVVLLSESHVHVIQPLKSRPTEALLAIGSAGRSVGLILSEAHARAASLEDEA
jgi:hypothetical protein